MLLERDIAALSYGSVNYNLHDENSDVDYVIFFMPTYDEIYERKIISYERKLPRIDIIAHDIRKLPDLIKNSSLNILELSCSVSIIRSENYIEANNMLYNIFEANKDRLANINLRSLYESTLSNFNTRYNKIFKGDSLERDNIYIQSYGYDTKQAMTAYRCLDFLARFIESGHKIKPAIVYNGEDRAKLLEIKYGKYSIEAVKVLLDKKHKEIKLLRNEYNKEIDMQLYTEIYSEVKKICKMYI